VFPIPQDLQYGLLVDLDALLFELKACGELFLNFFALLHQHAGKPIQKKKLWPELSVNDLKTWFRSRKYVVETLKLLPEMPEPIFIDQAIAQMAELGRINPSVSPA